MAPTLDLVEPAHLWIPEHSSTAGGEVIDLASEIGLQLDPEQELAIDALCAERPDGRWAALESAIIAPRQNIKTFVLTLVVLGDLYLFDAQLVVWTAHEFNTAMESFRFFKELIDRSPLLSRRVKKIVEANGDEGIEYHSGQRLRFKARTKTGGRGLTGDTVVLDEGFALQPSHMGSLMPTLSAKSVTGNPHILYGSSAGLVGSAVLRGIRDRGRRQDDPSLTYIEWCAPPGECAKDACEHQLGVEGCVLDDEERWAKANLALGRRISIDFILAERRSMAPEEFAREILGWWDEPIGGDATVASEQWEACADRSAELGESVTLAIDVAPGHTSGSIVACGGGVLHVVEAGPGTAWIPAKVAELVEKHKIKTVGLMPGPVSALVPDLEKPATEGGGGLKIRTKTNLAGQLVLLSGPEVMQACEMILSAIVDHRLVHRDQVALNTAVEGAYRRQVGDSWKWSRRDSSVDISPLVAATVAWFLWSQPSATREWFGAYE